jgi:hypothetical protein
MSANDCHLRAEIVQVVRSSQIVDLQGNDRAYFRHHSAVLARGYYVVVWSGENSEPPFNENARFYGPYDLALMAKLKIAEHVATYTGFDGSVDSNPLSQQTHLNQTAWRAEGNPILGSRM